MAGKQGYIHSCDSVKVDINSVERSINRSGFTHEEISLIWDFYVTHAIDGESDQARKIEDFGWKNTQNNAEGLPALEERLMSIAGVDKFCVIRAKTIKDTLSAMDLSNGMICVSHPRIVLMQKHSISIDENEKTSVDSGESRMVCLFRHIRNSFAHGKTYFFENGNVLLKDFDGNKQTAALLIHRNTLLDWIDIIDFEYKFHNCKTI